MKKYLKLEQRNASLDIIRIFAVFCVMSVHFMLHNGFYSQPVTGKSMYVMTAMRTFFSICVPLFIILTGYLMNKKTLSKKYYSGIRKTLAIFVLASIACMIFKAIHNNTEINLKSIILGTLDFTGANYSWYVEMYIGLFLLIPFLNLIYNNLKNQKQKQILVFTLFVLTILPSIINTFNFDTALWWADPKTSDTFSKLISSWWMGFYPIAYYFVGCYLKEFGLALKTKTIIFLIIILTIAFTGFNIYRCYDSNFKSGMYIYWYGIEPFVLSTLVFVLISRIKSENWHNGTKYVLMKVSDLVLGMYLLSYIFDELFYEILNNKVTIMPKRLPYYFIIVPAVFLCSLFGSAVLNFLDNIFYYLYSKIKNYIKLNIQKIKSLRTQDIVFIVLIVSAFIFSIWKCFLGFGGNDEAFYLTIPHRLTLGDALILDEWHLSQLSSILLLPFVYIFEFLTGSTEGIIFAGRIAYTIFHCFVAVFVYSRLRKYGYFSVFATVLYFLFTPFNIMALSYNTMGIDLALLSGIILATSNYEHKTGIIFSGLAFAGSVLCCPYLIFAYIIFGVFVILHYILKKIQLKQYLDSNIFSIKTFLFFTIGASILALVFLIILFSKTSINDIITNLPLMLTDPEHPQIPVLSRLQSIYTSVINCHPQFYIVLFPYIIVLIAMLFDKNRKNHRTVYFITSSIITIIAMILFIPESSSKYYNAIMLPIIFMGFVSYLLCQKKNKELFYSVFILGIIYSILICFTSNQYFYVISMVSSVTNVASFVFIGTLLKEIHNSSDEITYSKALKTTSLVIALFVVVLQSLVQINVKATHCFWESQDISTLNSEISCGPAKGIYTTETNCQSYEKIYNDITSYYNTKDKANILFLSEKTYCYLSLKDMPFGTFSAWISGERESSIDRLNQFYKINPDKKPKYIYIPKDSKWDFTNINSIAKDKGYVVNENNISYKLEKQ